MVEHENVFDAIMSGEDAERCNKISDALIQSERLLEEAGANVYAIRKMMRSVKFSELAKETN